MLIRIVRMTFQPDKTEEFVNIFNNSKDKIRSFPGCKHLELHADYSLPNIYVTYSIWESETALNDYRASELFKNVWSQTSNLFAEGPLAFSNRLIEEVNC